MGLTEILSNAEPIVFAIVGIIITLVIAWYADKYITRKFWGDKLSLSYYIEKKFKKN